MSCSGHCNVCPAHPGYDPPLNSVSWPDDGLGTDIEVKGFDHFYYLAYYINLELSRRSDSAPAGWWDPITDANFDTDDIIFASDYMMLKADLDAMDSWSASAVNSQYISAGKPILDQSTNQMRDQVDTLRVECLCNCNYSCTCNCNYCTCNCNYACTCDCNYSDRRLKNNIKYL